MVWLGEEFGNAEEMKKELKANHKGFFFCCCSCYRSNGRHPGLSAVSTREVQRARDGDEAIAFILPVRQSAPQFAFEGGGRREIQVYRWVNAARVYGLEIYLAAN